MAADVLRLADDQDSYCRLIDPSSGPIHVPITEISGQGALLDTKLQFAVNDYIDITLILRGMQPRPLFAHVVEVGKDGIRLRWLHFEPGDEVRLRDVLGSYQRGEGDQEKGATKVPPPAGGAVPPAPPAPPAAPRKKTDAQPMSEKEGTRRVIRPSTVFTPFGAGLPSKPPPAPAPAAETAKGATTESQRIGTRRIVRPATGGATATAAPPAETRPVSEDSGGQIVVDSGAYKQLADESSGASRTVAEATPPEGGTRRIGMVGADGKLDIGASIRSKAKTVRASELAARHDKVRVLNMATIKGLIQEAVAEAVQHLTASLGDTERKRLLEEAEAQFQERLKAFNAEKSGAEAHAKNLADQLKRAQALLEEERKRTIASDQFTVSEAGLGEIEDKMRRVLAMAMESGNVSPELQEQLRSMIAHILDSERERIKEQELHAQNEKIALLEKKINRLAGTLEETEKQRDEAQELARLLEEQGGGLRNVMSAGIKDTDGNRKRKLALMKEILDINRKIRDELGIELNKEAPPAAKPAAPAPVAATPPAAPSAAPDKHDKHANGKKGKAAPPEPAPAKPAPVAAAATASATESDTASQDDAPAIDPDDQPWEIKPISAASEDAPDGVKRIKVGNVAPPPLERKTQSGS